MMDSIYRSPFQVFMVLGLLAVVGIFSALSLPVSLFPNSTKPSIEVSVAYGSMNGQEFLAAHGRTFEERLRAIAEPGTEVERVTASYQADRVSFTVDFKWGTAPIPAMRAVRSVINAESASFPKEVRDSIESWTHNETSFFSLSFFSEKRAPDELFALLDPILSPKIARVSDAENPMLFNPMKREIQVVLNPRSMALLQLFPKDIDAAISRVLVGYRGGSMVSDDRTRTIELPRTARSLQDLGETLVTTPSGRTVHLSDVAALKIAPSTGNNRIYRTSGTPSVFLLSSPRPGANVKRMCEQLREIVESSMKSLPDDVKYKVIVDPSEFIGNAVGNVMREVVFGALLTVLVLYLFIGGFRNTMTAAIEIPLSMVLAFILMKVFGMNMNLISLGGLALSSGMNVDASVVVLENIFRHLESKRPEESKFGVIARAAAEVRFPVIASTLSSVVVFLPLAFTSDLTYAVLGDLAKTVVFSHAFSAIVALILVPTVRLKMGAEPVQAPLGPWLSRMEGLYAGALERFLRTPGLVAKSCTGLAVVFALLSAFVLPRLTRELVAVPETDWVILGLDTQGNTMASQMDLVIGSVEAKLLSQFGSKIRYTFTRVNTPNEAWIMARIKDRSEMREIRIALEAGFKNTDTEKYWVSPWNPSELPLPDPPLLRVAVRGGTAEARTEAGRELMASFDRDKVVSRAWSTPEIAPSEQVVLKLPNAQWSRLKASAGLDASDLVDLIRVSTEGRQVAEMSVSEQRLNVVLKYPKISPADLLTLGALPVGVGGKLVPLRALTQLKVERTPPRTFREDGREVLFIEGKNLVGEESKGRASQGKAEEILSKWTGRNLSSSRAPASQVSVSLEDPQRDLNEALRQLGVATLLSIALMLVTLVLQFGSVVNALLVLVSVPLGLIGVLLSLWITGSTLSLNSILGVILLNGITVANSIMLVDVLKKRLEEGLDPVAAALEAGRTRLRPILITSCTTILAMLPIAFGFGEGGRILQPLGIAVAGGLWISMLLTLFVVPGLQVAFVKRGAA